MESCAVQTAKPSPAPSRATLAKFCERLTPAGGTCDFLSCDLGLYCDSANTCQPYKSAGQSCAGYDECGPEAGCVEGTCGPVPISATKLCEGDYT